MRKAILTIGYVIALAIALFPIASARYNEYVARLMIAGYGESIASTGDELIAEQWELAEAYNAWLTTGTVSSLFEGLTLEEAYMEVLDTTGTGIMGYIEIPSIDVLLPIYHTVDTEVLQKGVGHMQSSALPIGGSGTHALLSGHRGLIGAALFSDLDQMELGDVFYITVLGEELIYEVTDIRVVLPSDLDEVNAIEGDDLVSLITCTPYGVNTHRLVVTGERRYAEESTAADDTEDTGQEDILNGLSVNRLLNLALIALAVIETVIYARAMRRLSREKEEE